MTSNNNNNNKNVEFDVILGEEFSWNVLEQTVESIPSITEIHAEYMAGYCHDLLQEDLGDFGVQESVDYAEVVRQSYIDYLQLLFPPQSGMEQTTNDAQIYKAPDEESKQNVLFGDQMQPYAYDVDSVIDPTRKLQDSNDADLGNFFSRPVKIAEFEWGTGTTLAQDIDPWGLYFGDKRVLNRIANFKLLRASLNLKIVINGNGFQYGRSLVSYLPYDDFDDFSTNAALIQQDLIQASQQPHVFLDPTTSTGGNMKLPFFWHKNYLDIVDLEWKQMGRLFFRSINPLKHANGATDKVTISVFAWTDDIQLSVLTSRNPAGLPAQSGEEIDEANSSGVISGPATALAKVSNAMSVIPPISSFALATSQVATAVAGAAKSMGYCRPPVTKNPDPFRNFPTSSLAVTNVPDTAQKLTVDDKQELTIDPRIAGLGAEDPLSIREIAKRESYLTTFNWNVGSSPETLLWNARVSPVTWDESGATPAYHFPACAMAALPFKYWTGSMNFRFQIVASTFHKGRIKIVYDPDYNSTDEYNINYMEVVDIADKQDFTITVGNGQTRTLLDHHNPGIDSATQLHSSTEYAAQGPGNGVLGVYIVNELTVPNSTVNNDIQVNVFVSMGDDFEVFVPDDWFQTFVFKPQSGEEIAPDTQNTEEANAPQQSMSTTVGPAMQDNAMVNMVFTGESVASFRQMLKRYNFHERVYYALDTGSANALYGGRRLMYPYLRGNVDGAVHETVSATPYNFVNTLLLHWVTYAFQGWRGSIRRKVINNSPTVDGDSLGNFMYIQRDDEDSSTFLDADNTAPTINTISQGASQIVANKDVFSSTIESLTSGHKGLLYVNSGINPTAEFEIPYYSRERFYPGKRENWTSQVVSVEGYTTVARGTGNFDEFLDTHVAIGEDFQTYFWTGLPRMYFELGPPGASPT